MKNAKGIALAAVGAAISLLGITLAYYVSMLTLTFLALSALGMLLPLSKGYYKEALLAYVAVSGIGAIYANVHILPFVLVTGIYTIWAVFSNDKKIKIYITVPVTAVYASFVFFVVYRLTSLFVIDIQKLNLGSLSPAALYIVLNILFVAAAYIYHYAVIAGKKYAERIIH